VEVAFRLAVDLERARDASMGPRLHRRGSTDKMGAISEPCR